MSADALAAQQRFQEAIERADHALKWANFVARMAQQAEIDYAYANRDLEAAAAGVKRCLR